MSQQPEKEDRAPRIPNTGGPAGGEGVFLGLMLGNKRAIEDQEAGGQRALVAGSQLPRKGTIANAFGTECPEGPAQWSAIGVQIIGPPGGWQFQPTEHSMWSDLVDDRDAHVRLTCRFRVERVYAQGGKATHVRVNDYGTCPPLVLHEETLPQYPADGATRDELESFYAAKDAAHAKCAELLAKERPAHEDPTAYWGHDDD